MNANGWEWMQDWYDAKWYRVSPERDPIGPPTGTLRSLRGYASGDYVSGLNLIRYTRAIPCLSEEIFSPEFSGQREIRHIPYVAWRTRITRSKGRGDDVSENSDAWEKA